MFRPGRQTEDIFLTTWRVLCIAVLLFFRPATAIRSWDDEAENVQIKPVEKHHKDDCSTWGDTFQGNKEILLWLDFAWFSLAAVVAVGILVWMPTVLRLDHEGSGFDNLQAKPIAWYRAAFQSLSSHAAGIVGFVGFNHLVVAKVLMVSDPCRLLSLCNCLLYVTLALSVVAVLSSCTFLVVDYMRRLAIDSARKMDIRLMLEPRSMEQTGLGKLMLVLAALMLFMFVIQIIYEAQGDKEKAEETSSNSNSIYFLLTSVGGCATVSLFYINLRQLHQSPKVQFDTTCHSAKQDKTLVEFLQEQSGRDQHGPWLSEWAVSALRIFAGEDLALLASLGSRKALFPKQRFTPLLHVLSLLIFIGLLPLGVHAVMERLFVEPELTSLKELAGDCADLSQNKTSSFLQSIGISWPWGSNRSGYQQHFLLLPGLETGTLQVTPQYRQTSRVRLCCDPGNPGSCENQRLNHSLTKFYSKPLTFPLGNASKCTLSLLGLSRRAITNVSLTIVSKIKHHFGSCSNRICTCSEGFKGEWDFHDWNNATLARLNDKNDTICNRIDSCENGYDRINSDEDCVPAPCDIDHSNGLDGTNCSCDHGFSGNITWKGANPQGYCQPAECDVENSDRMPGKSCKCADGFAGVIQWNGTQPIGQCDPAPCGVLHSNGAPGLNCTCAEKYVGRISWSGSLASGLCQPAKCIGKKVYGQGGPDCVCRNGYAGEPRMHGDALIDDTCEPAPCEVVNSNFEAGLECSCADGFAGEISWSGAVPRGHCQPAECTVKHSVGVGNDCRCADGFEGSESIHWHDNISHGKCRPALCNVTDSNRMQGKSCRCKDGFAGVIQWNGTQPIGQCDPAPCDVLHSNGAPGLNCTCAEKYVGHISWRGDLAIGECKPAQCEGDQVNGLPGPDCRCKDGYVGQPRLYNNTLLDIGCSEASCGIPNSTGSGPQCRCRDGFKGEIAWQGALAFGSCTPAECDVENSNKAPGKGCACLDLYKGRIGWKGPSPTGRCRPKSCTGRGANRVPGPGCNCLDGYTGTIRVEQSQLVAKCKPARCSIPNSEGLGPFCKCQDSFSGTIRWNGSRPHGSCQPAECDVWGSNRIPGPGCECMEFYNGLIQWDGPNATGSCEPMPCLGHHVNGQPGPRCRCSDGFAGSIVYSAERHGAALRGRCEPAPCSELIQNAEGAGLECRCQDGFNGTIDWNGSHPHGSCEAAECSIKDSNMYPGPLCKCKSGFDGKIVWKGPVPIGICEPRPCTGTNVNGIPGPGCGCADGYSDHSQSHDFVQENATEADVFLPRDCRPAACAIKFSTKLPGPECGCLHGYRGEITWNGSTPQGSCLPAFCSVPNSNKKPGWKCRCKHGYEGQIAWRGSQASGTCLAAPCRISNSDLAAGPACACLPGFYGHIRWNGAESEGECFPQPLCSENIVHITWLVEELKDSEGHLCEAGQKLLWRGQKCESDDLMDVQIRWISVQSEPAGRCEWHFPQSSCGSTNFEILQLFSMVGLPPPTHCSTTQPMPRCEAEMNYTIASSTACTKGTQNTTKDLRLVRFQGRQCGYDLIQWESLSILNQDETPAESCAIQTEKGDPLSCGQAPSGETLPGGCSKMQPPAVFEVVKELYVAGWRGYTPQGFIKFFENRMCNSRRPKGDEQTIHGCWTSDMQHIFVDREAAAVSALFKFAGFSLEPLFRRSERDLDGSDFIHYSHKFALRPKDRLPSWWIAKFSETANTFKFKADKLIGCRVVQYQNGICYHANVGDSVEIFSSTEDDCWNSESPGEEEEEYTYLFTEGATQTYARAESCLPLASRQELQLEFADVFGGGKGDDHELTVTATSVATLEDECRMYLRFVVDITRLSCSQSYGGWWGHLKEKYESRHQLQHKKSVNAYQSP